MRIWQMELSHFIQVISCDWIEKIKIYSKEINDFIMCKFVLFKKKIYVIIYVTSISIVIIHENYNNNNKAIK